MRKTLIALMFAAALPTVAMAAMPEGPGPMGGPEGHMMGGRATAVNTVRVAKAAHSASWT